MTSNTLPKSIHTVSALVSVGRLLIELNLGYNPQTAIAAAAATLGYLPGTDDCYGLQQIAVRKLSKILN